MPVLPDEVEYGGFIYILSDDALRKGDYYMDHQKYATRYGDPIEDCDSDGLAEFINRRSRGWYSRKIIATNDPVLNYYGVNQLT